MYSPAPRTNQQPRPSFLPSNSHSSSPLACFPLFSGTDFCFRKPKEGREFLASGEKDSLLRRRHWLRRPAVFSPRPPTAHCQSAVRAGGIQTACERVRVRTGEPEDHTHTVRQACTSSWSQKYPKYVLCIWCGRLCVRMRVGIAGRWPIEVLGVRRWKSENLHTASRSIFHGGPAAALIDRGPGKNAQVFMQAIH